MGKVVYPPVELGSSAIAGDLDVEGNLLVTGQTSEVDDIIVDSIETKGDIKDDVPNTIYDYSAKNIPNSIVKALSNLAAGDQLSAYPLAIGTDTDHTAGDHESGGSLAIGVGNLVAGADPRSSSHVGRHESGGADAITLANLANMGATAILIDTAANRPAAGTADRLFVDLTNGKIQRDTGTAWDDVTEQLLHASSHTPDTAADALSGLTQAQMEGTEPPAQLSAYPLAIGTDTDHTAGDHEVGGSLELREIDRIERAISGIVTAASFTVLTTGNLADGETLEIDQATFVMSDGTAVPSGCDAIIASLDNAGGGTSRVTILSGDGTTIYDDQTGNPLASWTNNTGAAITVAIGVDNGQWNVGSGADQDVQISVVGVIT